MQTRGYCALERFGPADGESWRNYLKWAEIGAIDEIVSLDYLLCPSILGSECEDFWTHYVPNENGLLLFDEADYILERLVGVPPQSYSLIWTFREPQLAGQIDPPDSSFAAKGYDLIEKGGGISALTNCGGWPELSRFALSRWGLLVDLGEATELQRELRCNYPEEPHADCDIWAVFRSEKGA